MTKRTIFFIILGLILVPISILIFWPDGSQPDDADLMLSKVELPPREENSYYILRDIGEVELKTGEWSIFHDHLEGEKWDQKWVDNLLERERNKEILDAISLAAQKPRFQDPIFSDPTQFYIGMEIGAGWSSVSRAVNLNSLKALNLIKQDKDKQGLERFLMSLNIAQKIQESQGTMLCYKISQAMKERSLEVLQNNIKELDLSPEVLIEYIKKLEKFKENEQGLKTAWKKEYWLFREMINKPDKGLIPLIGDLFDEIGIPVFLKRIIVIPGFHFQPNNTISYVAEFVRIEIVNTGRLCGYIELPEKIDIRKEDFFAPNIVGEILKGIFILAFGEIQERRCSTDFSVSGTQILLAIRAYEIETGNYPNQLEDLIPHFLLEISQDPFDGQRIRYCSDKKIIWSVGIDLIDQGGCLKNDLKLEVRS